ncbi:hypothetical protein NIES2104_24890 [Leptolyngbya sp. NIES-2104]|nr:hypothetical protein NIES2104_24890 [Leptolyngbya sp. NIES-2104]
MRADGIILVGGVRSHQVSDRADFRSSRVQCLTHLVISSFRLSIV